MDSKLRSRITDFLEDLADFLEDQIETEACCNSHALDLQLETQDLLEELEAATD